MELNEELAYGVQTRNKRRKLNGENDAKSISLKSAAIVSKEPSI